MVTFLDLNSFILEFVWHLLLGILAYVDNYYIYIYIYIWNLGSIFLGDLVKIILAYHVSNVISQCTILSTFMLHYLKSN